VTIIVRYSERLELNLVDYSGEITLAQLHALAAYGARHSVFLRADGLNVVRADATFNVDLAALDALFARYQELYVGLQFQIYRRSAWICLSTAAEGHIAHWTGANDMRSALSSTVRMFGTFAEAADWLLLSPAELDCVHSGESFCERARFDSARIATAR
jgi:hypothetical protein